MSLEIILNQDIDVSIEDIFSGPFDLLLHLVKKHELDLTEINLSVLTKRYLDTLKTISSYNIDIASDFLLIASVLINLKSKSIIPDSTEDSEDSALQEPETDILKKLLRFRKYSLAAEWLGKNIKMQNGIWRRINSGSEEFVSDKLVAPKISDLTKLARNLENRIQNKRLHGFYKPLNIPVKRKMTEILEILKNNKTLTLSKLFQINENSSLLEYVVSFIAVLELAKINLLTISQHLVKGEVYISIKETDS